MKTIDYINNFFSLPNDAELFTDRVEVARNALAEADRVLIGAGAGFSAAAGLVYNGDVFQHRFADFIAKYQFTDLYSSGFFPFPCEEEKWAYWARHISVCRWEPGAMPLYGQLLDLVRQKDYFVITTNVDGQFVKAGFDTDRIFATQGDYGKLQCAKGCHDTLYDNEDLVREMMAATKDCRTASDLVPRCPVCGGPMEPHLRCDQFFVENSDWHAARDRYADFLENTSEGKTVLLELGVGFNTPVIIRYPFERMAAENRNITLVRINRDYAGKQTDVENFVPFSEDSTLVLDQLKTEKPHTA